MKKALLFLVLFAMSQMAPPGASGQSGTILSLDKGLIVGVVSDPPYLIKGRNGEWTGFSIDIWKAVASELKVPYEFREMEFPTLLDALKEKRIDIAIDAFFMLAEREKYMDFTVPLGSTRLALATLASRLDHPWLSALRIFFSWGIIKIIILLLVTLCLLGLLLWYIERSHNPEHFGGGLMHGIGSGVYWVGSTLASGVCFGISLKSFTARIIGLVWMLLCTLMLSALTASLASSLTVSKNSADIVAEETLRDMHLAGITGSAEATILEKVCETYTLYNTEEDALHAVLSKHVDGYLYDEITLRYYTGREYKERITVYPTSLRRFSFAYGLPKDSPWRSKINVALMNFMERPDWAFMLGRYGFGQNFEEMPPPSFRRGKR